MAGQIPMTRNGVERLKEELHQLKSQDRPNIIQAIAEARAQGDLSENAEYESCLLYTSPSPRDKRQSRMPSSA